MHAACCNKEMRTRSRSSYSVRRVHMVDIVREEKEEREEKKRDHDEFVSRRPIIRYNLAAEAAGVKYRLTVNTRFTLSRVFRWRVVPRVKRSIVIRLVENSTRPQKYPPCNVPSLPPLFDSFRGKIIRKYSDVCSASFASEQ